MPKAIWKGEIAFGLVSIPVSLISTEENTDLHFHLLDAKTLSRIRYQRINEETGKEVPWNQIVKGYEVDKNNYIVVDETLFEKNSPELFKTIDINEFVNFNEIDLLYFAKPYYLVPESKNKKAYVLLREALKKTNKVGVAKVIIRTKESLALLVPHVHALLLYLIHFKNEIREETEVKVPKDNLKSYKISDQEIKMAMDLIQDMTQDWQPEKYHNEYQETLNKWLTQQIAKPTKKSHRKASSEDIVDFISLLKKSLKKNAVTSHKSKLIKK